MSIIDDVDGSVRYPFLAGTGDTPCDYELEFVGAETGTNHGDGKEFFKIYARVLASTGEGALQPGSMATIKIDEDTKYKMHKRDIRNVAAAVIDKNENQVTTGDLKNLLDPTNPAKGDRFFARRGRFLNEAKGTPFVATRFAGPSGTLPPLATNEQLAAAAEVPAPKGKRK